MSSPVDHAVAAGHSVAADVCPARWQAGLDELLGRVAGRFIRVEPRRRVRAFVVGLLADLPRKNCWTIAEHAGDPSPDGMQYLLNRAVWDADAVRDDVRDYVIEHLGDRRAVLVIDETGDVKKGIHSVGVQRQYTGTAGRIENAQVSVHLVYASSAGHALIDRELYLPRSWTQNPDRRAAAGVPADRVFATKPALATAMITRALDAGAPAGWVAGDEVYGADPALRAGLESRQVGYVLAIGCDRRVPTAAGPVRADSLAARLPRRAWQRLSSGKGAKGERFYDWAWITLHAPNQPGHRWLLLRRHRRTGELAYFRCYAPHPVSLPTLVGVAGRRWTVEESFQTGKGQTGLDEHQVRRWTSWYRWTTLVMLAHAFLAVATATARLAGSTPDGLIPLTLNEICHLFTKLVIEPARATVSYLDWSWWRRRQQHRAKTSHYQRQALREP